MSAAHLADHHAPRRMPAQAADMPAGGLRASNLTMSFGGLTVVDDVSLAIAPQARHAILGPNGAGKTTLFNLLGGDLQPSAGQVHLFDEDVTALPAFERIRRGMRRTFQSSSLFQGLSVHDNLMVAVRGTHAGRMSLLPVPGNGSDRQEVRSLLDRGRLSHLSRRLVRELSHGQQRQLEIAMALAGTPRMLLLDEPAAGLSPAERGELVALLSQLPGTIGFVLIEHDLEIALRVVDGVTVMDNGRVVRRGSPAAIMDDPHVQAIYMGHRGHGEQRTGH